MSFTAWIALRVTKFTIETTASSCRVSTALNSSSWPSISPRSPQPSTAPAPAPDVDPAAAPDVDPATAPDVDPAAAPDVDADPAPDADPDPAPDAVPIDAEVVAGLVFVGCTGVLVAPGT
mmetsp:Transcript_27002/g.45541  ORF Transcript_27002/g.45541 Transcript_27002/m.45541 type:complete len:120 (+) Transcript_27002:502-861(+)